MSCACENRRRAMERDRIYRLAKGWAMIEGRAAAVYLNADGTYGFCAAGEEERDRHIIEYVTPY